MRRFLAIASAAAALACLAPIKAVPGATVQTIVDSVSTASYRSYQLTIEGMGPDDGSGIRNRDWAKGGGASAGNRATRVYLEKAFAAIRP